MFSLITTHRPFLPWHEPRLPDSARRFPLPQFVHDIVRDIWFQGWQTGFGEALILGLIAVLITVAVMNRRQQA